MIYVARLKQRCEETIPSYRLCALILSILFFLFFLENAGYSTKLQLKKKKGWLRPSRTYFMITQWFTSCRVTGTAIGSEGKDEGFYRSDYCSQNCDGGSCSGWVGRASGKGAGMQGRKRGGYFGRYLGHCYS